MEARGRPRASPLARRVRRFEMSALGGPRDGGGPPARALLPALQTRATPRRCPRTSTVDHDQSPSTATARSLEYPSVTTDEAQLKIREMRLI